MESIDEPILLTYIEDIVLDDRKSKLFLIMKL